jgi:gamma-glutamylcysteine synthetase
MGATKYVSYASALVVRQLKGVQYVPRMAGLSYFLGLFKDQYALEVMKNIKQDWKLLVLVKKESDGLRDQVTS